MQTVKFGKPVFEDVLVEEAGNCGLLVYKVDSYDSRRGYTSPTWRLHDPKVTRFLCWSWSGLGDLVATVWFDDAGNLCIKSNEIGWSATLEGLALALESRVESEIIFYDAVPTTNPPESWKLRREPI